MQEYLVQEYFKLIDIVHNFDQRLLTIKGWSVTLSAVALGLGFQYQHYGFFIISALSSLSFWIIEGSVKRFQMRHYVRLWQIETAAYEIMQNNGSSTIPPLQINWSWNKAHSILIGKYNNTLGKPESIHETTHLAYRLSWFMVHVMLPHIVIFVIGIALSVAAYLGAINIPL